MATVFLGMGSNIGNRQEHLDSAIQKLRNMPSCQLRKVSKIFENPPLEGGPLQGNFFNIVAELETTLKPLELLDYIQKIEKEGGRQRLVFWGPRTIDIDIIFYDNEIIDLPTLKIPHPEMYHRDFVILPLLEIAPMKIDPKNNELVSENWAKARNNELTKMSNK